MPRNRLTIPVIVVSFALPLLLAQNDPKAAAQLQAAINKETVVGDLKGAIADYKKLAEGASKAVAAQALVRLGECYEKQGNTDARKTYEQVLSKFGDQKDAVVEARARLAALGGGQTGQQTIRLVLTGDKVGPGGTVSPDGHYISFADGATGNLVLHDLISDTDRLLTNNAVDEHRVSAFAQQSAISRDGKQVAFAWDFPDKNATNGNRVDIRVANLTGDPNPRVLFDNPDVAFLGPKDWSPDGKWIAVWLGRKDRNSKGGMGLIATQDGSLRVLDVHGNLGEMRFSTDGKYLAYDRVAGETGNQRGIYILAIDSGAETQVVSASDQNNHMVGWSPDGKQLLFAGDGDLWAVPFSDGKPQAAPAQIKKGFAGDSMGITTAGAIYIGNYNNSSAIRIASVDLSTGRHMPQPVLPLLISAGSQPNWSPDGKYLAYISGTSGSANAFLAIRLIETGEVRALKLSPPFNQFAWAPDSRSLVFTTGNGLARVDVNTGATTVIASGMPAGFAYRQPQILPDGKRVKYLKVATSADKANDGAVIVRDLVSGTEREVFHGNPNGCLLSPDGHYCARDVLDSATNTASIVLVPIDGGEPREAFRYPRAYSIGGKGWTPDGRSLIVWTTKADAARNTPPELWLYPIDGGTPRKLDIDTSGVDAANPPGTRVHPDGRQIAYEATTRTEEISALENFLPTARAAK